MSAAIDTTSDVEILESLDFDPEHPCEWGPVGAKHGAASQWLMVLSCCGNAAPFCHEHKAATERSLAAAAAMGFAMQCGACGAVNPGWHWVPLKGGA